MRIDFGLMLGILLEYIYFVFYANTLFDRKMSECACWIVAGIGYLFHFIVCMFGNVIINIFIFYVVNYIIFKNCYYISKKTACFQSVVLTGLSMSSELILIFIPYFNIVPRDSLNLTAMQSFLLTMVSKTLYLISMMFITGFFCKNKKAVEMPVNVLLTIPMFTIIIMLFMINLNINSNNFAVIAGILVLINMVVFVLNQKMVTKELENIELKKLLTQERMDFTEYEIIKEKQIQAANFMHDFKEHINAISVLIQEDNKAAKEYVKKLYNTGEELVFKEYSNNKFLNIVLNKKYSECKSQKIKFSVDPIVTDISFIEDEDVVSIFSNLINNAIEACAVSENKNIFLSISEKKKNYISICMENSSDKKPIVVEGILKTHKKDSKYHGIGMRSVKNAIEKYNGNLYWEYNEKEKIFGVRIIILKDKN